MVRHTPGPMTTEACVSEIELDIILDYDAPNAGSPILVATCFFDDEHDRPPVITRSQALANARLFASAPDLLLALEMSIDALRERAEGYGEPDHADDLKRALAAIAKAKGHP